MRTFVVLLACLLASSALQAQSFQELDPLQGGGVSLARGISGDGSVIVGYSTTGGGDVVAVRWGGAMGPEPLAGFAGLAVDASEDGSVIVGSLWTGEPVRWEEGALNPLDLLPGDTIGGATGVTADGATVVGYSDPGDGSANEAVRWTAAGNAIRLGDLPGGGVYGIAWDVSADGSVVVGWSMSGNGHEAFRWTAEADSMAGLGDLSGGGFRSEAYAVSADGTVVVGKGQGEDDTEVFRWTEKGDMVGLGTFPGAYDITPQDVSADGDVIVGQRDNLSASFIWTAEGGIQDLQTVLEDDYGLDLTGWTLRNAYAISDDGTVIVGWGTNPDGDTRAWRAELPRLRLLTPAADELVIAGEEYVTEWTRPAGLVVDLVLLPDTLGPVAPVEVGLFLDADELAWTPPDDLFSRAARLVVRESLDETNADTSAFFRIKPYHLTRLSDDEAEYVPFDVARHSWAFDNDADPVFPPSWWMHPQFDYFGGFDPFTGDEYDVSFVLPPISARPSVYPDWPSFVRAFGPDDTYHLLDPGRYVDGALSYWAFSHEGKDFEGGCFGMAVSSLLAFEHRETFGVAYPGIGPVEAIHALPATDAVRELVNEQYARQFGTASLDIQEASRTLPPRETLAQLQAVLLDDPEEASSVLVMLKVTSCDPFASDGGHSVVPYRLERDPDAQPEQERWRVYVYDPNRPDDADTFVVIDANPQVNSWYYQNIEDGAWPSAECGFYLANPIGDYLWEADLPVLDDGTGARGTEPVLVGVPSAATVVLAAQDGSGAVSHGGGAATSTLPGAQPIVPIVGGSALPLGYRVPAGAYDLTLSDAADSTLSATFFDTGRLVSYGRADATPAQTDRLAYDPDGLGGAEGGAPELSLRSDDPDPKAVTLRTILTGNPSFERTLDVEALTLAGPDSVRLATPDGLAGPTRRLANGGGAQTAALRRREASGTGEAAFLATAIPLEAGATHTARPDWAALADSLLAIDVDRDGDGSPDTTLVIENEAGPRDYALSVTPTGPLTVAPGGTLGFDYAVANHTAEPASGDLYFVARRDGGVVSQRVVQSGTLPGGATVAGSTTLGVPVSASPGVYALTFAIGSAFGVSVDEAVFEVTVTGSSARSGQASARGGASGWAVLSAPPWGPDEGRGAASASARSEAPPGAWALHPAYPNPFSGRATVRYDVPEAGPVRVAVYDALGREVAVLVDGEQAAGTHEVAFDAGALSSGVYLARMTAAGASQTQRLTLLR
ncbi:MAG: T9SS type A sorting domain-containing protein [Rubricoccaceae bacterium]|nr:T9SS type A sorting domain-containing protein [Rubricoccaceae bacterium]